MRVIGWVTALVYSVVLLAGLYYVIAGISPGGSPLRLAGFVAGIGLLFLIERLPARHPAALLGARLVLFVAVAALDESGLSRILFLLVPFLAYLQFGRAAGLWLGAVCLGLLIGGHLIWVPGWYTDAMYVSDVLMFCVGLVLAMAMAAVARQAQQTQARLTEMSVAMERTRLARDIHDSLGHHLTAIAVQLEKSTAFRERDPAAADQAVKDAHTSARRALADVRSSVRALREPFDLPTALKELADDAAAELKIIGTANAMSPALTTLYRAAQESLTNVRRHAKASAVSVTLTFSANDARLEVADDGKGFDTAQPEGFGLQGMRERAELVGGNLQVRSRPGEGTRITVTVPA